MRRPADRLVSPPFFAARHPCLLRAGLAAVLALAATGAFAQAAITIYGGARAGGEFVDANDADNVIELDSGAAASLSVDWSLSDGRQAQLFFSHQRSALPGSAFAQTGDVSVGISYLHLGGRAFFDGTPALGGGYAVGGLGITHLSPGLDGLAAEVRPSLNLGVGYQWALSRQVALRAELRGYVTLVNSDGGFFCSGGCVVSIRGDTMTQVEGMLGLSVGF
jgi:hypothetical protein